jgi:hypothetical protein
MKESIYAGSGDSIHLAPDLGAGLIPGSTAPISDNQTTQQKER